MYSTESAQNYESMKLNNLAHTSYISAQHDESLKLTSLAQVGHIYVCFRVCVAEMCAASTLLQLGSSVLVRTLVAKCLEE
jgi:hypothetical protein